MPQYIQGMFMMLFFVPIFSLALGSLRPKDMAGGAGLLSFGRTMSGAFATSMATTSWYDAARSARVHLLDQTSPASTLHQISALGLSPARGLRLIESQVQGQSVMLATDKIFISLGLVMVVAAFSIWLTPALRRGVRSLQGN